MSCKRFFVKIDLQLHAITCPGVWLCAHGLLEATIETLGYILRTDALAPKFPLICDDYFTMEGYFESVTNIHKLKEAIASETIHILLWQNGCLLSYFTGTLNNILPTVEADISKYKSARNINALQMIATAAFPGIIAPKIELSAEVFIKDRFSRAGDDYSNIVLQVVSRNQSKFLTSEKYYESAASICKPRQRCQHRRQKTVCHAKDKSIQNKTPSSTVYYSNNESLAYKSTAITTNELNDRSCYCDHCAVINLQATDGNSLVQHVKNCSICQLYQNKFF